MITSVTDVTDQNPEQTPDQAQGLPLRGMAMILIAVALLLAAWGAYSMTRDDNAQDVTVNATNTPAAATPAVGQQATGSASAPATAPSAAAASAGSTDSAAASASPAAAAPNATAGQASDYTTVHVLNNSTVQGLAADVADQLKAKGFTPGEVGNYADDVVPENTVYFPAGNAAAEQAARELADRVGGIAAVRPDNLPAGTDSPNSLVLVLATETTVN